MWALLEPSLPGMLTTAATAQVARYVIDSRPCVCRAIVYRRTAADGTQSVQEIKDDLGIAADDKDEMVRRLMAQGVDVSGGIALTSGGDDGVVTRTPALLPRRLRRERWREQARVCPHPEQSGDAARESRRRRREVARARADRGGGRRGGAAARERQGEAARGDARAGARRRAAQLARGGLRQLRGVQVVAREEGQPDDGAGDAPRRAGRQPHAGRQGGASGAVGEEQVGAGVWRHGKPRGGLLEHGASAKTHSVQLLFFTLMREALAAPALPSEVPDALRKARVLLAEPHSYVLASVGIRIARVQSRRLPADHAVEAHDMILRRIVT